ncbi:MAG TPA: NAD(P)-dependent oxidoreductase, partial [Streptosporangiaceae bacterium]|nr:NAD(P)-dependent oxidoreductase [Streptosporangiaceae bacterium]
MRVFVAGATGAIGKYLVPGLVAAGHEVTGSTRSPTKASQLKSAGATPALVDGLDRQAVLETVKAARPDVIVHQMTALASMRNFRNFDKEFAVTNELRTKGTDYLLEAAQQAGVRVKTETVPGAVPEGLVLRYGMFYGPGASESMLDVVKKRRMPVVGGGTGIWSFTEVTDAAAATAAAVNRGAPGICNVVDDHPAPVAQWLPYLSECLGVKPPMRAPAWMGKLLARELVVSLMPEAR